MAMELLKPSPVLPVHDNVQHVAQWESALWAAFSGIARAEKAAEKAEVEVKGSLSWKG